jgi:hypothetical protein
MHPPLMPETPPGEAGPDFQCEVHLSQAVDPAHRADVERFHRRTSLVHGEAVGIECTPFLESVSAHVYLYLAQESGKFGQHSLARLVSPDFYLHSDPGANLNFDNAFSVRLGIAQPAMCHRTPTCLP